MIKIFYFKTQWWHSVYISVAYQAWNESKKNVLIEWSLKLIGLFLIITRLYLHTCIIVVIRLSLLMTGLSSIVLACLGFLSPANRGALMTCAVVLWVLLGTPAGYVSARLYKSKILLYSKWWSHECCKLCCIVLVMIALFLSVLVISFWGWKVEDKRLADSTVVPRVCSQPSLFVLYYVSAL